MLEIWNRTETDINLVFHSHQGEVGVLCECMAAVGWG